MIIESKNLYKLWWRGWFLLMCFFFFFSISFHLFFFVFIVVYFPLGIIFIPSRNKMCAHFFVSIKPKKSNFDFRSFKNKWNPSLLFHIFNVVRDDLQIASSKSLSFTHKLLICQSKKKTFFFFLLSAHENFRWVKNN